MRRDSYKGYKPKPMARIFRTERDGTWDRLAYRYETPQEALKRLKEAGQQFKNATGEQLDALHHQINRLHPHINISPFDQWFWDYTGPEDVQRHVDELLPKEDEKPKIKIDLTEGFDPEKLAQQLKQLRETKGGAYEPPF